MPSKVFTSDANFRFEMMGFRLTTCVCRMKPENTRDKRLRNWKKSNMSTFDRFNHLVERFQSRRIQMRTDRHFKSGNSTLEKWPIAQQQSSMNIRYLEICFWGSVCRIATEPLQTSFRWLRGRDNGVICLHQNVQLSLLSVSNNQMKMILLYFHNQKRTMYDICISINNIVSGRQLYLALIPVRSFEIFTFRSGWSFMLFPKRDRGLP